MISSAIPRRWLRRPFAGALLPLVALSASHAATYLQSVNQTGSGDWHTLALWNTNGADTPAGTAPASINSGDHFVASHDGWSLRTPTASSTFQGGSLTLGGTAQLLLTGGSSAISTVPALTTTGGAIVGGGTTRNFSADTLSAVSGSASFTSTSGGVINLFVGDLVGSGNLTISGPGKLVPSIDQAGDYTGTITVHNGGTLHVLTGFDMGGRLAVNSGGNVILDDDAHVASLTVAGTVQPAGTYTSADLGSGFSGGGQLVVADAGSLSIPTEVIVDNLDATLVGGWVSNTHVSGYYGVDYHHDNNTGKGTKTAQFTPTLTAAGSYEVFIRWTAGWNRATNAPVTITHAGGTDSTTVNQQLNNNTWVSLGSYDFAAGTAGNVILGNAGTNGHVMADAVKFVPLAVPTEVIVDNVDATLVGTWVAATHAQGYYGTNYHHDSNTGKGTKTAQFTPSLTAAGSYEVFMRWTAAWNRATNAPVTITHAGGTDSTTVNQQQNNNAWYSLGTYDFAAGTAGSVTLGTGGSNGHVIADAVRFTPATGTPPPPPPPAFLFYDNFESGNLSSDNEHFGWSGFNRTSVITVAPQPAVLAGFQLGQNMMGRDWSVITGSNAMRATYNPQSEWAEQRFTIKQGVDEVWFQFDLRVPSNFSQQSHGAGIPSNSKIFYVWMDDYSNRGDGSTIGWEYWQGGGGVSQLAMNIRSEAAGAHTGHIQHFNFINPATDRGRWMTVRFYMKVGSGANTADGVVSMWRRWHGEADFTRHHHKTDVILGNIYGGFQAGYVMGWHNGLYTNEQDWLIDNFIMSTVQP